MKAETSNCNGLIAGSQDRTERFENEKKHGTKSQYIGIEICGRYRKVDQALHYRDPKDQ